MLLRNESKVRHFIEVNLIFDDNTVKELTIQENDFVHLTFKRDGYIKVGTGIITKIEPYIKARYCNRIVESAMIVLDMSEDNMANVEKIMIEDIVDIRIVNASIPCEPSEPPKSPLCDGIFPSCVYHHNHTCCKPSSCQPPCTLPQNTNCPVCGATVDKEVIDNG